MSRARSTSPNRWKQNNHSPTRNSPVKLKDCSYDPQLKSLLRERDELKSRMEKCERQLIEVQANNKVLTAERDTTSLHYQQAQDEIAALREDLMKSKTAEGSKGSLTARNMLKRIEAERTETMVDLLRMTTERDSLRERLQISQETAISEKAHLEQRVEDLQNTLLTLEKECAEEKGQHLQMRNTISALEEEVHTFGRKLNTNEEEILRLRSECTSLRLVNNCMESSLKETQRRLTDMVGELQNAEAKNKRLAEKNELILKEANTLQEELSKLQNRISELGTDADTLKKQLEEATNLLNTASSQLDEKEHSLRFLEETNDGLESALIDVKEKMNKNEKELNALKMKLSNSEKDLVSVTKIRDNKLQENNKLVDNFNKALLDIQDLELKLNGASQEIETLERKGQVHFSDNSQVKDLLSAKELECLELQESQRQASLQVKNWEEHASRAEVTIADLKLQLRNANSEILRLKEITDNMESSLQQALNTERRGKNQLSQLKQKMLDMEEALNETQGRHLEARAELEKTQELCIKLDASKDAMQRALDSCCCEVEQLQKQLDSERQSGQSLQSQLVSARESQKTLKEDLSMADKQMSLQNRELVHLRTRSSQLEADLEMTKRHLSTERLERELRTQELRAKGLLPALSITRPSSPPHTRSRSSPKAWSQVLSNNDSDDPLPASHRADRKLTFKELYD